MRPREGGRRGRQNAVEGAAVVVAEVLGHLDRGDAQVTHTHPATRPPCSERCAHSRRTPRVALRRPAPLRLRRAAPPHAARAALHSLCATADRKSVV